MRRKLAVVALAAVTVFATTQQVQAGPAAPAVSEKDWKVTPLTGQKVTAATAPSARLARTDPSLLGLTSDQPLSVVVKFDYDSLAAYRGGVAGLAATSPGVTGRKLNRAHPDIVRYEQHVIGREEAITAAIRAKVPGVRVGQRLRLVYGGVALRLPANQIGALLSVPGVTAVQKDAKEQPLTDASGTFIGAPTLYNQLSGSTTAGEGVIVANIDTGVWPEHPSFAARADLPSPQERLDGQPRPCEFGDNPLTVPVDVFACTNKLIGGKAFMDAYNAEFGDETYPSTARDSDGHGTHTLSTAAGNPVAQTPILGRDRGPIQGIAPGAHVVAYKACGPQGCFNSDLAQAVGQALLDEVNVINYSISGGQEPWFEAASLAFLDAYAAGVLVSAAAGNSGPFGTSVSHSEPWVLTVGASTQARAFQSTLTLQAGAVTRTVAGASIDPAGVPVATPVAVAGTTAPYNNQFCTTPAPAGVFAGKVVLCEYNRSIGRITAGFNVAQGGAAGMILANTSSTIARVDPLTDTHWIPTVHIDDPATNDFIKATPELTASFTAGEKVLGTGDAVTRFSSRGPAPGFLGLNCCNNSLKPDVVAPGHQILAGDTPTPNSTGLGPAGELFQAISGTSMAAPHGAGAAALLMDLHPEWTPGQIKSALMTTAKTGVTDAADGAAATVLERGAGRIDLTKAGNPGLTFDETASAFQAVGNQNDFASSFLNAIDLNVPSLFVNAMPGEVTTVRYAKNVTNQTLRYQVSTTAAAGTTIAVTPSTFSVRPGRTVQLRITVTRATSASPPLQTGEIMLTNLNGSRHAHLPVGFFKRSGAVTMTQTCAPASVVVGGATSRCDVQVRNNSDDNAFIQATSTVNGNLGVTTVDGATRVDDHTVTRAGTVPRRSPSAIQLQSGTIAGYVPLDTLGVTPTPLGDEEAVNIDLPASFNYDGVSHSRIGLTSNGYAVVDGVQSSADIVATGPRLPDPTRPNGVLAPFWTNLTGVGAPGIYTAQVQRNGNSYFVAEWRLNIAGTTSLRVFQLWLHLSFSGETVFIYDPANLPTAPPAGVVVGAENLDGSSGNQLAGAPTGDLRVVLGARQPGLLSYSYTVQGIAAGPGEARTSMTISPVLFRGTAIDLDAVTVTAS